MSTKKIIWIVNPFDPLPGDDQHPIRYSYLAKELIAKNCKVIWWSSNYCHFTKSFRPSKQENTISGLEIRVLRVLPYTSNISTKRFVSHFVFSIKFFMRGFFSRQKPDLILASLPPLFSPFFAMILSRLWNIPGVVDVQDLWPDAFASLKSTRNIAFLSFLALLYSLRKLTSRLARGITGVSELYVSEVSRRKSSSLPSFPLGASSSALLDIRPAVNLPFKKPDDIWLLWGGSVVGEYTDISLISQAAYYFQFHNPSVKFIVTGNGDRLQALQHLIAEYSLNNVFCLGLLRSDDFWYLNSISDVGLCAYTRGAPHSFVNKVYSYLAAGLPVVNSLQGETWDMIDVNKVGLNYHAGNSDEFVARVEQIINCPSIMKSMSFNASSLIQKHYTKVAIYSSYADSLLRLIGSPA